MYALAIIGRQCTPAWRALRAVESERADQGLQFRGRALGEDNQFEPFGGDDHLPTPTCCALIGKFAVPPSATACDYEKRAHTTASLVLGTISNERALRRRLVASGRADGRESIDQLVERLFEVYAAKGLTVENLLCEVCSHLQGKYSVVALLAGVAGPILATAQRGTPLWYGRQDGSVLVSDREGRYRGFDMAPLRAHDQLVVTASRFNLIDREGMRIERPVAREDTFRSAP